MDGAEELKNILKTSLVPLECYFPGQIVRQDTDSVHSAITSVLRPFQHTAMLDHTQTQKHRHTNNIHQNISRTTVYQYITHKAVLQKLSLLLSEMKLVGFFMYLTLFTKPKSILEFSVAKALRISV